MSVEELINKLKEYPKDMIVGCTEPNYGHNIPNMYLTPNIIECEEVDTNENIINYIIIGYIE